MFLLLISPQHIAFINLKIKIITADIQWGGQELLCISHLAHKSCTHPPECTAVFWPDSWCTYHLECHSAKSMNTQL